MRKRIMLLTLAILLLAVGAWLARDAIQEWLFDLSGESELLPQAIAIAKDHLPPAIGEFPGLEPGLFGLIMVLFIIFEPMGLYGRWVKLKLYFQMFPLYRRATFKRQKTYLKTERVQ